MNSKQLTPGVPSQTPLSSQVRDELVRQVNIKFRCKKDLHKYMSKRLVSTSRRHPLTLIVIVPLPAPRKLLHCQLPTVDPQRGEERPHPGGGEGSEDPHPSRDQCQDDVLDGTRPDRRPNPDVPSR